MPKPDKYDKKVRDAEEKPARFRPRGLVTSHEGPDEMPAIPTVLLKGVPAHPKRYTITDGVITWNPPISIYCPVTIMDGETKVMEWTAAGGEV